MHQSDIESTIISILNRFNVEKVGIFGSYARHEQQPSSDLDILVSFNEAPSLLQIVRIEKEISEAIGMKVDLVSEKAIKNKKLKNYINKDLKVIYNV